MSHTRTAAQIKREEEERKGRIDFNTGIAKAVVTLSGYGEYDDIPKLMSEWDSAELKPPMLSYYLTIEKLTAAERFVQALIELKKAGKL